jgi:hypothetical protein
MTEMIFFTNMVYFVTILMFLTSSYRLFKANKKSHSYLVVLFIFFFLILLFANWLNIEDETAFFMWAIFDMIIGTWALMWSNIMIRNIQLLKEIEELKKEIKKLKED